MQKEKFKVLLYLKKSGLDKSGQAPIMGRITYGRTIAQFSCKLSCDPKLWNARESRLNGKSREAVATNGPSWNACFSRYSRLIEFFVERGIVFTSDRYQRAVPRKYANSNHLFGNDTTEWSRR